ncbi:MAG: glycosyltransferase [Synergistaceae bacterium]|jgi:glycosyltransferase involved in cell wall biosynthesis|nr:glycosyltransferase [Synergistaceae bacterium]
MSPEMAVIVATKDRAEAIRKYALPSLNRSEYRDFVCVVWDASRDEATRAAMEEGSWEFQLLYFRAPRPGSSSQRNDAARYVLEAIPSVRHVVFIDDDSELSPDALGGVRAAFQEEGVRIVNIRMKPVAPPSFRRRASQAMKRLLGMNRHGATPYLYNYGGDDEPGGIEVDWASGGGMGVDVSVFKELRFFFLEEFQRFGGYALGEDFAFSYYVSRKGFGRVVNSREGYFLHYAVGSARLDVENMAASKWYNFHLLFDRIYGKEGGLWLRARFKLFMCAATVKLLFRARSLDVPAVLRGVSAAREQAAQ